MATRDVFSEEELGQLRGFPEIIQAELIRYFTLTPADEMFVRKFRGSGNVLGAAVQLCTLPWLGFVPDEVSSAPRVAVDRLAERLQVAPEVLAGYAVRDQPQATGSPTGHDSGLDRRLRDPVLSTDHRSHSI